MSRFGACVAVVVLSRPPSLAARDARCCVAGGLLSLLGVPELVSDLTQLQEP